MFFHRVALLIALLLIANSFASAQYELRNNALYDNENKQVTKDEYVNVLQAMSVFGERTKYNETIVEWLINNGLEVDVNENLPMRHAARFGHTLLVAKLLNISEVDPSACDNEAIRLASDLGHSEVVKILLKDERVVPSANNNEAIRFASVLGHSEVVKLLVNDPRVDPSANDNYAIRLASQKGHSEVVKHLLKHEKVVPSAIDNYAIRSASENGHFEVVKLLLNDKRVDPSAKDNEAITYAATNARAAVVEILLTNSSVDATRALKESIKKKYYGIVSIISKARPKLFINENDLIESNETFQVKTTISVETNNLIIHYESEINIMATFVMSSVTETIYLNVESTSNGKLSIELNKLRNSNEWNWRWICAFQSIENSGKFHLNSNKSTLPDGNKSAIPDIASVSEESIFSIWVIAAIVISAMGLVAIVGFVWGFIRSRRLGKN